MEYTLKFICSSGYDFVNEQTGERITGVSTKCFDPESKLIVKVKSDHIINAEFGDDITVSIVPKGNYITYVYEG